MSQDFPGAPTREAAVSARSDPRGDAHREPPIPTPARSDPGMRHADAPPSSRAGAPGSDHRPPADGEPSGDADGLRVNLEFDFPSDVNYIERVVAVVIRQCEEFRFAPRQCALNVPVALSEALSNAILRGNGDDRRKQVRVRAHVDRRALVLEVADEGQGFDYASSMRDPTAPENISREDGRGLYLMQRLMDHVERFTDRGNVVRLTLKRGG